MKTAIYIEDGVTQAVLTAENEHEKKIIGLISSGVAEVNRGSFYECRGGYFRYAANGGGFDRSDDDSAILVIRGSK